MPLWGASAKGGVHPQSKGGVKTHGGVSLQRVGTDRKGFPAGGTETQMNFAYAKGRAETRPDALSIFLSLQEIKA